MKASTRHPLNKTWTGPMPTHEALRGCSAGPGCELNSHRTNSDQHTHPYIHGSLFRTSHLLKLIQFYK